jgi:RNA polymerase sigma factor (sigma-70 family)
VPGVRSTATDAEVLAAAVTDPDRFAVLYDRYAQQLYAYARRRLGHEIAQDVIAETFIAAFKARARYQHTRPDAKAWLYSILTKQIALHHRNEVARFRMLARLQPDRLSEGHADRVSESASAQAARAPLIGALNKLSNRDRDVLLLVAWEDLTYEQVADVLGIPVGTVRSRLNRARRKIRKALADSSGLEIFQ